MSRRRVEFGCGVVATAVAASLWGAGLTPRVTVGQFLAEFRSRPLQPAAFGVENGFISALWLISTVVLFRVLVGAVWLLVRQFRRSMREVRITGRGGVIGFAFMMLSTMLAQARLSSNAAGSEVALASDVAERRSGDDKHALSHLQPDPNQWESQGGKDVRRLLPALTSAGLAVGLTSHIQRERATLLKNAPLSATLRRPSARLLSTAVTVFERARDAQRTLPQLRHGAHSDCLVLPLGAANNRLVSLAVSPGETVSIESTTAETIDVLRHVINTLALAPWLGRTIVIAHGFGSSDVVVHDCVVYADDAEHAAREAIAAQRQVPKATVVLVTSGYSPSFAELAHYGVMVISSAIPSQAIHRVLRRHEYWEISTTGERFAPYGLSTTETETLTEAVLQLTSLDQSSLQSEFTMMDLHNSSGATWHTMVRVFGHVCAQRYDAVEVTFRKSKSMELLCWLATHRDRPTVSGARTAMWELDVQDSTFHNVLSELRRGLSAAGLSNAVGRVNRQRLFLDRRVVTDEEALRSVLASADDLDARTSLEELLSVLSLVSGLPFAATNYAWADAEGITSTLVWLATQSVQKAAALATELNDSAALVEISAAGLRMMPGDDEFSSLAVPAGTTK